MRHYTRAEMEQVYNHIVGERLAGVGAQGINEVSQVQRYRTGARMQLRSGVYHYAMANGILDPDFGAKIELPQTTSQEIIGAAAAAGAISIVLTLDNTDGPAGDGLLPLNYLEGGTVVVFAALGTFTRGILTSTAVTVNAATATFTVTLDAPIPVAITIADVAEANASPYRSVVPSTDIMATREWCSVAGMPTRPTVVGDWTWLLTWGTFWASPDPAVGGAINNRLVYFGGDGAVQAFVTVGGIQQIAGFIQAADKGTGQGAPFITLQLDP